MVPSLASRHDPGDGRGVSVETDANAQLAGLQGEEVRWYGRGQEDQEYADGSDLRQVCPQKVEYPTGSIPPLVD